MMSKKIIVAVVVCILALCFAFTACETEKEICTSHIDADGNGICDICGEETGKEPGNSQEPEGPGQTDRITVSFDLNGGKFFDSGESDVEAEKGTRITLPKAERDGYVFCGWYDGDDKWNVYDVVDEDVTLKARWLSKSVNQGKITVRFVLNDGTDTVLKEVSVNSDGYVSASDVPSDPVREGYCFAGWHTRDTIGESDLVGGVSKYMYYIGQSKSAAGIWNPLKSVFDPVAEIENITDKGVATLYARWVKVKSISTEEELNSVRNDLYGAYELDKDIVLTQAWQPIGSYYSNYELFETKWWIHAFRGSFDGNGHSISGLRFNGAVSNHEDGLNAFVDEGVYGVAITGLFGSIVDPAVISDLVIDGCIVSEDFETGCYTGILGGFMMGGTVSGVNARNSKITISSVDGGYLSVTGLIGASWSGTIIDCKASGEMHFTANRKAADTGEIFVGGISGECYSNVSGCESDYSIVVEINDESTASDSGHLQVSVGGINGANCYLQESKGTADIRVLVHGGTGKVTVRAGLAVGIERYGYIRGCVLSGEVITDIDQERDNAALYCGSILGGFDNSTYALIGAMFDPALKVRYVEENTVTSQLNSFVGEAYADDENFTYAVRNNSNLEI